MNQLENDLELQIRRLDIICKSKGLPRPKRQTSTDRKPGGSYVSPYGQRGTNSVSPSGPRNNSGQRRPLYKSPNNYTPPNRRDPPNRLSPGAMPYNR